MDPTTERIVANMGIDVRRSFLPLTERHSNVSDLRPIRSDTDCTTSFIHHANVPDIYAKAELSAQTETEENFNVAAILFGDGEFHLGRESYFGSSSLDGTVSGFWLLNWDSLDITWAPKMHHHFYDWP